MGGRGDPSKKKRVLGLRKRVEFLARRFGFSQECEDIAQEACLIFLATENPYQTAFQTFVDALRRIAPRTRGGRVRDPLFDVVESDNETALQRLPSRYGEICGLSGESFEYLLNGAETTDRCVLILYYVWGLSEKEIGHCFGVTESRISQRLGNVQARIRRALARDKPGESARAFEVESTETQIRSIYSSPWSEKMAGISEAETFGRSELGETARIEMAEFKPRAMETDHETGFDPWLT